MSTKPSPSAPGTQERVLEIVRRIRQDGSIQPSDRLVNIGVDSLDAVEIFYKLENEFSLEVDLESKAAPLGGWRHLSVGDLCRLVLKEVKA